MYGRSPDAPLTGGTPAQYVDYFGVPSRGQETEHDEIVGHTYPEHGRRMKEIADFPGVRYAMDSRAVVRFRETVAMQDLIPM